MRITKIARKYLRTWFIFDLIIVGCLAFGRAILPVLAKKARWLSLFMGFSLRTLLQLMVAGGQAKAFL